MARFRTYNNRRKTIAERERKFEQMLDAAMVSFLSGGYREAFGILSETGEFIETDISNVPRAEQYRALIGETFSMVGHIDAVMTDAD